MIPVGEFSETQPLKKSFFFQFLPQYGHLSLKSSSHKLCTACSIKKWKGQTLFTSKLKKKILVINYNNIYPNRDRVWSEWLGVGKEIRFNVVVVDVPQDGLKSFSLFVVPILKRNLQFLHFHGTTDCDLNFSVCAAHSVYHHVLCSIIYLVFVLFDFPSRMLGCHMCPIREVVLEARWGQEGAVPPTILRNTFLLYL